MKFSILTAALQELTPRDKRDPDPDLAVAEWLQLAREIGLPNIQLSAAPASIAERCAGGDHARSRREHFGFAAAVHQTARCPRAGGHARNGRWAVLCEHELPGTARHDPLASPQNRSVDWLDHQLAARELLSIDPANTYLVVEHEYPPARIQDRACLAPILKGSLAFVKAIDEAAAAMYSLQHEVLQSQGVPIQGIGREAYRS